MEAADLAALSFLHWRTEKGGTRMEVRDNWNGWSATSRVFQNWALHGL